jgi:hypothetical protein
MMMKNSENDEDFSELFNLDKTGFRFILCNIPDEEIIEILQYNPNFLENLCFMSTLEEQIFKEKKLSISNKN